MSVRNDDYEAITMPDAALRSADREIEQLEDELRGARQTIAMLIIAAGGAITVPFTLEASFDTRHTTLTQEQDFERGTIWRVRTANA